jgi:hypothetical protein
LDVYKRLAPSVIRLNQKIEVWAGAFGPDEFENKEHDLNRLFRQLQGRLPWVDRDG